MLLIELVKEGRAYLSSRFQVHDMAPTSLTGVLCLMQPHCCFVFENDSCFGDQLVCIKIKINTIIRLNGLLNNLYLTKVKKQNLFIKYLVDDGLE